MEQICIDDTRGDQDVHDDNNIEGQDQADMNESQALRKRLARRYRCISPVTTIMAKRIETFGSIQGDIFGVISIGIYSLTFCPAVAMSVEVRNSNHSHILQATKSCNPSLLCNNVDYCSGRAMR